MRSIRKYIAGALSAAMIMTSAFAQGAVVSYAEEQDVGIVATAGDAEADGVEMESAIEEEAESALKIGLGADIEEDEIAEEGLEVQGDGTVTDSGLRYEVTDDDEITITDYYGTGTKIEIPEEIDGKKVTSIGGEAFYYCRSLESITIPSSVTSIGACAFLDCSSLTSVSIPNSVTSIEYGAFENCTALTSITIPSSVTKIGDYAFGGCSSLKGITIPLSVISIGGAAFEGCSSLTNIEVEDGNKIYDSRNECNAIIETESDTLISGCKETVIPPSVIHVGAYAFRGCSSLTSIAIPDSVVSIGWMAFEDCSSLTDITIPNSVTSIDGQAFCGCSSLPDITIPPSVISIGGLAFDGCDNLTSITIPSSVNSIGEAAFSGCKSLTHIEVEDGNKVYDSRNGCNAIIETASDTLIIGCKETVIPPSVVSIGRGAFEDCSSLTDIIIPDGVTSIGNQAFLYCSSLTDIIIPDGVTSIGNQAFSYCSSLTNITIPNGVTNIGAYAFEGCSSLTGITIPDSITSIGGEAFEGCSSLMSIEVGDGNKVYDSRNECNAIIETASNTLILGCKETVIPSSVTSIGYRAFFSCSSLTDIVIPDGVTSIGDDAFRGCGSCFTSITIPDSVTSIGYAAFMYCWKLTIICNKDSTAYQYAMDNDIPVRIIGEPLLVTSITLSDTSKSMEKGSSTEFTATVTPTDATNTDVAWSSSNAGVAKVDEKTGKVTAVAAGTATITCTAADGSGVAASCEVTVINPAGTTESTEDKGGVDKEDNKNVSVKRVSLDKTTVTLNKGETVTLAPTVTPSEATDKTVTWKSDNTKVATVDEKTGKVTAVAKGTANITCTAADESGVTASCTITVTQPVTSIKLNASSKTIAKGKSVTLKATVKPSDATDKTVTWKSSNTKVAKVDKKTGKVTAKKVGTATITCTSADGKTKATCKITVKTPVTKIKLNKTKSTLKKGKSVKLKATVTPTKAYKTVTWKSSNTKVATVSSSGKVTAKKKGTATITCTAADGSGKKVTCKITVK